MIRWFLVAALLAGCSAQTPLALPLSLTKGQGDKSVARTMARHSALLVHRDTGRSWMRSQKKGKSILMYAGAWSTQDVYVYDYPSGKHVGTLTGFDGPYGGCVDAKGDVYIANFYGGTVVEYAHGGTKILKTYTGIGEPIGCSVGPKSDLAATSFSPGGATVFAGGNPSKGTTYTNSSCGYQWTMGYDNKGNLIGVGETTSITVCALLAGSTSETTLTTSGITIDYPGGTMWDGKYIALGDQEAGGTLLTGVWPAALSGTTLTAVSGEVKFATGCSGSTSGPVNPFILGKKNTPVNDERGTAMVGPLPCPPASIGYWHYPAGGDPYRALTLMPPQQFYGVTVSVGT